MPDDGLPVPLSPRELDMVPTDDLYGALERRFKALVLVTLGDVNGHATQEDRRLWFSGGFSGGFSTARGLLALAAVDFDHKAAQDRTYEDEED